MSNVEAETQRLQTKDRVTRRFAEALVAQVRKDNRFRADDLERRRRRQGWMTRRTSK